MGILSSLFNPAIKDPIQTVGTILDELFTSEEEVLKQHILKARLVEQSAQIQAKISELSASHRSVCDAPRAAPARRAAGGGGGIYIAYSAALLCGSTDDGAPVPSRVAGPFRRGCGGRTPG